MKIKLGGYNTLRIVKSVDFGMYLDGGDEGEILLPTRYVPKGARVGDDIEVFIYLDQDEKLIATTLKPLAKVGNSHGWSAHGPMSMELSLTGD